MKYILRITGHKVYVFLGKNEWEKLRKRLAIINIQMFFNKKPEACDNDDISGTYCYSSIVRTLNAALSEKQFELVENMTRFVYDHIKSQIGDAVKISVEVIKPSPMEWVDATSFVIDDGID